MNILFTNSKGPGHGGAEISIPLVINELKKRGHKVLLASAGEFSGIDTIKIKNVEKWPYFLRKIYLKKQFAKIIKKYSIDLITPQDSTTTPAAVLAAKQCGIASVVHMRDLWFACPRSSCLKPDYSECTHCSLKNLISCAKWQRLPIDLYKWHNTKKIWKLINKAEEKIVVSNAVKDKLAACGIKNNINVVHGARNYRDFQNIKGVKAFKAKYKLKPVVVTFIGSFFYTKGILQVLKFMPDILRNNKNVSLMLVGDGPLYGAVKGIIKNEGIGKQVVLTGRLPFDKMPLCYAASDILLAPHLWTEPLGATIIEASAAGKASLISEKGGPSDFKGRFDYILPPEDTKLWGKTVSYLINHPSERKRIGIKARKSTQEMSVEPYMNRLEQIYIKAYTSRKN